jgi:hypothetical protein
MAEDIGTVQRSESKNSEDLAPEIARSITRKPREQVTCRRVNQDYYRCNWWSQQDTEAYDNPSMAGLLVTTSRITRSQFLHVTKAGAELKIRVIASDKPQPPDPR